MLDDKDLVQDENTAEEAAAVTPTETQEETKVETTEAAAEAVVAGYLATQRAAGARFRGAGQRLASHALCVEAAFRTVGSGRADRSTARLQGRQPAARADQTRDPDAQDGPS